MSHKILSNKRPKLNKDSDAPRAFRYKTFKKGRRVRVRDAQARANNLQDLRRKLEID